MKKLIIGLFLAVGLSLTTHVYQSWAVVSTWQKGVSIQSRFNTDFASASFRQSVDNAAKIGVNYVTLVIPVHQDSIHSSNVYAGNDTPTDDALKSGLSYIKSKGMGSAIAIHDNPYDYQWRAFIDAADKNMWFSTYGSLANHYAAIGQSVGVNQMVIATELSSMTVQANTDRWKIMIRGIRQQFNGALTYSAQRTGYMADAQSLGFWSDLDKIGISAYYGLGNDGSVQALSNEWNKWNQQEISVLAAKYNKPIIFTEVGYVSRDGATNDPGTGYNLNTNINTSLQANAYEALFSYWNNYSSVQGAFMWDWSSDPNAGGNGDGGYTPQNKPAEAIMKKWFTSGGTTTLPPVGETKFTVSAQTPASLQAGSPVSVPVQVSSNNNTTALVDIEVYDQQGQRVAQAFFDNQALTTSAQNFTVSWTPQSAGSYTVKAGIFTPNWQRNLLWNDNVSTLAVTQYSPPTTPPPVVTPPAPPVTPPTPLVTPPTPPTTPPVSTLPTDITIWWPGGTVSGVQPYKAVIDGRDLSTYDIFWQVDGGTLNKLDDNTNPVPHKESLVDMTNWRWNASKKYTVNFVAKDKAGNSLSAKSVVLTLGN